MNWWITGYFIGIGLSWGFLLWDQLATYGGKDTTSGDYMWAIVAASGGAFVWPIIVVPLVMVASVRAIHKRVLGIP